MSRRRDRERFQASRALNPDYRGFRGYGLEPDKPGQMPMQEATCSVCGHKRNVPVGVALAAGDTFVCESCQENAAAAPEAPPEAQPPPEQPGQLPEQR